MGNKMVYPYYIIDNQSNTASGVSSSQLPIAITTLLIALASDRNPLHSVEKLYRRSQRQAIHPRMNNTLLAKPSFPKVCPPAVLLFPFEGEFPLFSFPFTASGVPLLRFLIHEVRFVFLALSGALVHNRYCRSRKTEMRLSSQRMSFFTAIARKPRSRFDPSSRRSQDSEQRPFLRSSVFPPTSESPERSWRSYLSLRPLSSDVESQHTHSQDPPTISKGESVADMVKERKEPRGRLGRRAAEGFMGVVAAGKGAIKEAYEHVSVRQDQENSDSDGEASGWGNSDEEREHWLRQRKKSPPRGKSNEGQQSTGSRLVMVSATKNRIVNQQSSTVTASNERQ